METIPEHFDDFGTYVRDVEYQIKSGMKQKEAIHLVTEGQPNMSPFEREELADRLRRHFKGEESDQMSLGLR